MWQFLHFPTFLKHKLIALLPCNKTLRNKYWCFSFCNYYLYLVPTTVLLTLSTYFSYLPQVHVYAAFWFYYYLFSSRCLLEAFCIQSIYTMWSLLTLFRKWVDKLEKLKKCWALQLISRWNISLCISVKEGRRKENRWKLFSRKIARRVVVASNFINFKIVKTSLHNIAFATI